MRVASSTDTALFRRPEKAAELNQARGRKDRRGPPAHIQAAAREFAKIAATCQRATSELPPRAGGCGGDAGGADRPIQGISV